MAKWLWHTGWEVQSTGLLPFIEQDLWDGTGWNLGNPRTPRSGQYSCLPSSSGLSRTTDFLGHYVTRTDDFVFWHVPVEYITIAGASSVGDDFVYARCCKQPFIAAGNPAYMGVGFRIAQNPITLQATDLLVAVHEFAAGGALTAGGRIVGTTQFPIGHGWIHVVVEHEIATRVTKLYVDGVKEGANWTAPAGIYQDACINQDNQHIGGKAPQALTIAYDDWGCKEDSSAGGLPGTATRVILYPPKTDIVTAWTPVPVAPHYFLVSDERQGPLCPAGFIRSGAVGQRDGFAMADEAAGTIEGARGVWRTTLHDLEARINPAAAWTPYVGEASGGSATIHGRQMDTLPAGGAWTTADFNNLEQAIVSRGASQDIHEFYNMGVGPNLVMPDPTICGSPAGLLNPTEVPRWRQREIVSHHHH